MNQRDDHQLVTETTVTWSVQWITGRNQNRRICETKTGIGWAAFIETLKILRCVADEDVGDQLVGQWRGCDSVDYQFTWDSCKDAPGLLPAPEGLGLDIAAEA